MGSRGQLKGLGGGQGAKPLVKVQGASPLEAVVFFNAEKAFSTQTCIHNIVKFQT